MQLNGLGASTLEDLLQQIQRRNATPAGSLPASSSQGAPGGESQMDPATEALMEALSGILGNAASGLPADLLAQVAQHGDPRLFFQEDNQDSFLNAANSVLVAGGDLAQFLTTAKHVKQAGGDLTKFYGAVQNVMTQGDYDDLERFFNVADVTMATGNSLDKLYQLSSRILGAAPDDFEAVIFAGQATMMNGGTLSDFEKILDKTNFYGFEGRNNLVDFHRVLVAARKSGMDMKQVLGLMGQECAAGANGRDLLDEAMDVFKLADSGPDFDRFDRIERVDSGPMTITQGESAALFCQVVSTRDGLLSGDYVCWSSEETGAVGRGNYLDLSKLGPGTYHFVAKVDGGGDTAIKTVTILPKAADDDCHDDGNNGHGNDPGKVDSSNPGNSKPTDSTTVKNHDDNGHGNDPGKVDPSNPGNSKPTATGSAAATTSAADPVASLLGAFAAGPATDDINPLLKMFRLYQLNSDSLTATEVFDFIDDKVGKGTASAFLRSIGANQVADEYDRRDVTWESLYAAQIANPNFYDQCTARFRQSVTAEDVANYLKPQGETDPEIAETLWLLGYRAAAPAQTTPAAVDDGNNGHGNDPGQVDLSNPGKSKFAERLEALRNTDPNHLSDAEIEDLFTQMIDITHQIEEIDRLQKAYQAMKEAKDADSKREQQRLFWDQLMAFINQFLDDQAEANADANAQAAAASDPAQDASAVLPPKASEKPPEKGGSASAPIPGWNYQDQQHGSVEVPKS